MAAKKTKSGRVKGFGPAAGDPAEKRVKAGGPPPGDPARPRVKADALERLAVPTEPPATAPEDTTPDPAKGADTGKDGA